MALPEHSIQIVGIAFWMAKDPAAMGSIMSNLRHISPLGARLDRGAAMHAERANSRTA
jgi:hypothetical protein